MTDIEIPVGQVVRLPFTIRDQDGLIVDVSTASVMTLTLKRVGAASVSKTLTLTGDGTDGEVEYTTTAADLDSPGIWRLQGIVTISTVVIRSKTVAFNVTANL